jgi:hypothetical protein
MRGSLGLGSLAEPVVDAASDLALASLVAALRTMKSRNVAVSRSLDNISMSSSAPFERALHSFERGDYPFAICHVLNVIAAYSPRTQVSVRPPKRLPGKSRLRGENALTGDDWLGRNRHISL